MGIATGAIEFLFGDLPISEGLSFGALIGLWVGLIWGAVWSLVP
jgi:hypothetical protein